MSSTFNIVTQTSWPSVVRTVALLIVLNVALISLYLVHSYRAWRRNLVKAEESGLRVDSSPIYMGQAIWQVGEVFMMPLFERLPKRWTSSWIDVTASAWSYHHGFTPYTRRQTDIITVASPGGVYMSFANAEAIAQICERRNDFQKPTEVYGILNIFGSNLLTQEGNAWRRHRKVVAPAFSEKNNMLVWDETIKQTQALVELWSGWRGNELGNMLVPDVHPQASDLSLHVISRAGFGVPLSWDESSVDSGVVGQMDNTKFKQSLKDLLHHLLWFAAFSPKTLGLIPLKITQKIWQVWSETKGYWEQLLDQKLVDLREGRTDKESMDLMLRFVEESGISTGQSSKNSDTLTITAEEIIGNSFVIMVAGHESTANSIQNALIMLATNLAAQRHLQKDVDAIVETRTPEVWDYKADCDRLYNSMVGAVINEQLRLLAPVSVIPKILRHHSGPQHLHIDSQTIKVPAGTFIHLNAFGVHRNPRYWPHSPSKRSSNPHDLCDFVPERWLVTDPSSQAETLYNPPRGAFIPFSDGQRGCIGRRFALVELTAVLTVLLSQYSVELAVGKWATEAEVVEMDAKERTALYQRAVDSALWKLDKGCESLITLKLAKGNETALRFVKRGEERFA